jgi:SAM-dependent methyltransferase
MSEQRPPSLIDIFHAFTGYQRTFTLKAGVDLDVFTAVGEGATTPTALAARTKASERGLRILCDRLVVEGFLTKSDGHYGLSPEGATFLDRRSPAFLGSMLEFLASPHVVDCYARLGEAVRRGGTVVEAGGAEAPEHPMWVAFARAMATGATVMAEGLANVLGPVSGDVLDVAAGHGMFGITLARKNPGVRIVALDWANVLEVATENARAAGVADRFRTLPGSAFDVDFGGPYDVVLVPNFLHHFDQPTNTGFLRKVRGALKPGGRVAIVEFVPNDDRVTPPEPAAFAATMLATTPAGDAYTFAEYRRMLDAAGYGGASLHELPGLPARVVVASA